VVLLLKGMLQWLLLIFKSKRKMWNTLEITDRVCWCCFCCCCECERQTHKTAQQLTYNNSNNSSRNGKGTAVETVTNSNSQSATTEILHQLQLIMLLLLLLNSFRDKYSNCKLNSKHNNDNLLHSLQTHNKNTKEKKENWQIRRGTHSNKHTNTNTYHFSVLQAHSLTHSFVSVVAVIAVVYGLCLCMWVRYGCFVPCCWGCLSLFCVCVCVFVDGMCCLCCDCVSIWLIWLFLIQSQFLIVWVTLPLMWMGFCNCFCCTFDFAVVVVVAVVVEKEITNEWQHKQNLTTANISPTHHFPYIQVATAVAVLVVADVFVMGKYFSQQQ